MTTRAVRGIALYQVIAGAWGLADPAKGMFVSAHTGGQYTLAVLVTALMVASIVAGVLLWRGSRQGRALSRAVQAVQIPVVASKWVVYSVTLGLACVVGIRGQGPSAWAGLGPYVTIGFTPLTYVPQLSINIVPLILWRLLRPSGAPEKRADEAMARAAA